MKVSAKALLVVVLAIFTSLLTASAVRAQASASLTGKATDTSGAAVPGAQLTVTNVETRSSRSATTEDDGSYRVLSLPVGNYEIEVGKQGFRTEKRTGINLVVGQEAIIDFTLEVGQVSQTVTVSAEAPVVNVTTADVSGLVGEATIKDLPLNGRSFDNLITLNSGSANLNALHPLAATGAGFGNLFAVSGRDPESNIYLLNGVKYVGAGLNSDLPGGASGQLLGIDGIREFNVLKENYSAEYGNRAGAQILAVTQGGSNTFHGTAFEFLRNDHLDARNYFDSPPSVIGGGYPRIPRFERNNFGGAVGGPIQKDKTFIFGNYEGLRQRLGLSNKGIVPDANMLNGQLPCDAVPASAGGCPANKTGPFPLVNVGIAPGVANYLALWPKANGSEILSGGLPTGSDAYFDSPVQAIREDFATVRIDHTISASDTLTGVYTGDDGKRSTPDVLNTFLTNLRTRNQVASISETHTFSSDLVNTATFGYSRGHFNNASSPLITIPSSLTFIQGLPMGQITVGTAGATATASVSPIGLTATTRDARNLYSVSDNIQLIKGKHQFAFGVWFNQVQDNENEIANWGTASFGGNASIPGTTGAYQFLTGQLTGWQGSPQTTPLEWRTFEGAWYAEDTIKVRSNLTLTLGLRHEFSTIWHEAHGRAAEFVLGTNGLVQTQPDISPNAVQVNNGILLFSPRVGLAWDVFGNGKTAVHAGFGTYYDMVDTIGQFASVNPPFNGNLVLPAGKFPFPAIVPGTTGGAQIGPVNMFSTLKTPTTESYNLNIQQQLTRNMSLTAAFDGLSSYHNIAVGDYNTVPPLLCGAAVQPYASDISTLLAGTSVSFSSLHCPASVPAGAYWYLWYNGGVGDNDPTLPNPHLNLNAGTSARRNPALQSSRIANSFGDAHYAAGYVELTQRFASGFSFKANYTFGRAFDNADSILVYNGGTNNILNTENVAFDWGRTAFNVDQRFSFSGTYALPLGAGKTFAGTASGVTDKIIGGWQVNTIITAQTGFPINPILGNNASGNGNTVSAPDRPSWNPNFSGNVYPSTAANWYNTSLFVSPIPGTYGNVGRYSLLGPGLTEVDLSILKSTAINERFTAEFRAEAFNILNHTNLGLPNPNITTGGVITLTATTSRQLQFGVKLLW